MYIKDDDLKKPCNIKYKIDKFESEDIIEKNIKPQFDIVEYANIFFISELYEDTKAPNKNVNDVTYEINNKAKLL